VPERFRHVQWMDLPGGHVPVPVVEHLVALLQGVALVQGDDRDELPSANATVVVAPKRPAHRLPARRWLLVGGLLFAVALSGAWVAWRHLARDVATTEIKAPPSRPRIAVLPFENLSPDSGNAFFADGVHEELLATLANDTPGLLDVISSTTMSVYRGKPVLVPTLARDLNCTYVLEGSVRREGNLVRLTLQLIDARDDRQIWAESYDRTLGNAMALEREVATAVTSRLSLKLSGVQSHAPSVDPAAYDLYLKARGAERAAFETHSVAGIQNATQLLGQAIEADPNFVRAHLERMSLRLRLFLYNHALPDDVLPLAGDAVEQVVSYHAAG
jgi:adenylate cyclase